MAEKDYGREEFNELRVQGVGNVIHMSNKITRIKDRSSFGEGMTVSWTLKFLSYKRNSKPSF